MPQPPGNDLEQRPPGFDGEANGRTLPIRQVAFVLTERCNLRCVYCYERFKNKRRRHMSADAIKRRIGAELTADNGFDYVWFIFFGGEPLLRYETIRDVVEWSRATAWPAPAKEFQFMVETNSTLLNAHMKQWFAEHRDHVILSVSLDGTKDAHDRNRSNSYDKVAPHADFLCQNWPDQPVKMTVGPETIEETYEGVLNIRDLGLNAEFDVLFEDVWGDEDSERRFVRIWAEQLDRLVEFLRRPSGASATRCPQPKAEAPIQCASIESSHHLRRRT